MRLFTNFRDVIALLLGVVVFPVLWVLSGTGVCQLPEVVVGASISIETLIAQFYFRKATDTEKTPDRGR